jgi:hypothetical protein
MRQEWVPSEDVARPAPSPFLVDGADLDLVGFGPA